MNIGEHVEVQDIPDYALVVVVAVVALICWRQASRLPNRAGRKISRVIALAVAVSCALLLSIFLLLGFWERGMVTDENLTSPDGKHIAQLRFFAPGAMGEDIATVLIRPKWTFHWDQVYRGAGTKDQYGQDAKIRWLDSKHLLIQYLSHGKEPGTDMESKCRSQAAGIDIVCEPY